MRELRYIRAINEALHEEMARDETVVILGEDVGMGGGAFGATRGLYERFGPERVMDMPISEAAITGIAAGAAAGGMRPVVEIMFMDFVGLCMDAIVNQIAKLRYLSAGQYVVPVVLRLPAGGGLNAGPQHSQCLEAWFAHVPGLKVVMPSTPYDAKGLLKAAIRDDNPVMVVEHKALYPRLGEVPKKDYVVPIGEATVRRQGKDVTVVATSRMVWEALEAAKILESDGIDVEVIDLVSVVPWDKKTVFASVSKTHKLVIAHEAVRDFGIGAEIAASVAEELLGELDAPIIRVGAPNCPVPFALERFYLPGQKDVIEAVRRIVTRGTFL